MAPSAFVYTSNSITMKKHIFILLAACLLILSTACEREQFEFETTFWDTDPNQDLARIDSIFYSPHDEILRVYFTLDTAKLAETPKVRAGMKVNHSHRGLFNQTGKYYYIQRPERFFTYEFGLCFAGRDGYTRNYADTTFTTW